MSIVLMNSDHSTDQQIQSVKIIRLVPHLGGKLRKELPGEVGNVV